MAEREIHMAAAAWWTWCGKDTRWHATDPDRALLTCPECMKCLKAGYSRRDVVNVVRARRVEKNLSVG